MTRVIVVTSGKGGVGKTNLSVNIGAELARRGQRTCLLDADLGMANVNIILGIEPSKTIDDYVFGDESLTDIIVTTPWALDIIPGCSGIEKMANLDPDKLQRLSRGLASLDTYDFLLIDTSSGISRTVISFCLAAAELVLVLSGEKTSLTDGYGLLKALSVRSYKGHVRLLVNKCISLTQARDTYVHFKTVTDKHLDLAISPLGAVLAHDSVEDAMMRQKPFAQLFPDEPASQCLQVVVDNLLKNDDTQACDWTLDSYWNSFFQALGGGGGKNGADEEKVLDEQFLERLNSEPDALPEEPVVQQPAAQYGADKDTSILTSARNVSCAADFARLPLSPVILRAAVELLLKGTDELGPLAEIIGGDPVLAARLVELHRISTDDSCTRSVEIGELLGSLGADVVKNFLVVIALQQTDTAYSLEDTAFTCNLGRYGLCCALLCRQIANHVGYPCPEEAYLAGLLHGVGYFSVRSRADDSSLSVAYPASYASKVNIDDSVAKHSSRSGPQVGATMAAALGCSPMLVGAICYQNDSLSKITTAFDLTKILYVAIRLCYATSSERSEAVQAGMLLFRLNANHLLDIVNEVEQDLLHFGKRYGLASTSYYQEQDVVRVGSELRQTISQLAMLQLVFPRWHEDEIPVRPVRKIFQNLYLLFGIRRAFCLVIDEMEETLLAQGYPGCFCENFLAEVSFPCSSESSMVAAVFRSRTVSIVKSGQLINLSDRHLASKLQEEMTVFLPLSHNGAGGSVTGVVVFGCSEDPTVWNLELVERLQQFGTLAGNLLR